MYESMTFIAVIHLGALASPGATALLILNNARHNRRNLTFATAGGAILSATLHITLASAGLGYFIHQHAHHSQALQLLGAGYLLYIGGKTLYAYLATRIPSSSNNITLSIPKQKTLRSAFSEGFLTQLLNIKTVLFFSTIFSQVITPTTPITWTIVFTAQLALQSLLYWTSFCILIHRPFFQNRWKKWHQKLDLLFGTILICLAFFLFI